MHFTHTIILILIHLTTLNMIECTYTINIPMLCSFQLERLANDTNEDISLRKVAVFEKHDDQVFDVIHKRLGLIASKSKSSRVLNKYTVTNYGLTGHYLPHEEHIDNDHLINSEGREAIVIFHVMYFYFLFES